MREEGPPYHDRAKRSPDEPSEQHCPLARYH
jgi:hypothetical protein